MALKIRNRNLVVVDTFDGVYETLDVINFEVEDYAALVLDITKVIYWLNIESVWGQLGFTWTIYNDYGTFNARTFNFNIIPTVPDGYRLQRWTSLLDNFNQKELTLMESDWSNIYDLSNMLSNCSITNLTIELGNIFENLNKRPILNNAFTPSTDINVYFKGSIYHESLDIGGTYYFQNNMRNVFNKHCIIVIDNDNKNTINFPNGINSGHMRINYIGDSPFELTDIFNTTHSDCNYSYTNPDMEYNLFLIGKRYQYIDYNDSDLHDDPLGKGAKIIKVNLDCSTNDTIYYPLCYETWHYFQSRRACLLDIDYYNVENLVEARTVGDAYVLYTNEDGVSNLKNYPQHLLDIMAETSITEGAFFMPDAVIYDNTKLDYIINLLPENINNGTLHILFTVNFVITKQPEFIYNPTTDMYILRPVYDLLPTFNINRYSRLEIFNRMETTRLFTTDLMDQISYVKLKQNIIADTFNIRNFRTYLEPNTTIDIYRAFNIAGLAVSDISTPSINFHIIGEFTDYNFNINNIITYGEKFGGEVNFINVIYDDISVLNGNTQIINTYNQADDIIYHQLEYYSYYKKIIHPIILIRTNRSIVWECTNWLFIQNANVSFPGTYFGHTENPDTLSTFEQLHIDDFLNALRPVTTDNTYNLSFQSTKFYQYLTDEHKQNMLDKGYTIVEQV